MRVPRRLLPLLACALIAGTPAVAHAQGGAGDDQYQDPFGGSSSGGGSTSSGGGSTNSRGGSSKSGDSSGSNTGSTGSTGSSAQSSGSNAPELTQDPDLGTSSPTPAAAPAPAPATSATAGAAASRSELPRTGFDAPIVALLGIGLLAAGLGLRLRVAHGRRSS
jgi:LPXTG-motif cell wall-anchored protein